MAAAFISGRFVRLLRPPGSGGKRPTHPQRRINAPISSFICSPTRVWILKGRSSGFGSAWQLVEPAFWSIKNCRIYGRLHQRNAPICHFCQSRSPRLSAQGRETGPCCASYANLSFMFWGFLFSRTHTHTHTHTHTQRTGNGTFETVGRLGFTPSYYKVTSPWRPSRYPVDCRQSNKRRGLWPPFSFAVTFVFGR